jgi:hypothetical protein
MSITAHLLVRGVTFTCAPDTPCRSSLEGVPNTFWVFVPTSTVPRPLRPRLRACLSNSERPHYEGEGVPPPRTQAAHARSMFPPLRITAILRPRVRSRSTATAARAAAPAPSAKL